MSRSDRATFPKLDDSISEGFVHAADAMRQHMERAIEVQKRSKQDERSKYHREIKPGVWVDCYDVLKAWNVTCPALQHAIKKALAPGNRGHKTLAQDMDEIVQSALRARELAE